MPELVALQPEMFPDLYADLLHGFNPDMPEGLWRRTFAQRYVPDAPLGYALRANGKYVGVLGLIFSKRRIRGSEFDFCNVHTWMVEPEYRTSSLLLMRPLMKLTDHTLTDMSPTSDVAAVSRRLGFRDLDRAAIVLPPRPGARREPGLSLIELAGDNPPELTHLTEDEQRIYRDHRALDCGHLLLREADGYCLVVYSRIQHGRVPGLVSCHVHYLSDPGRFVEHHAVARRQLMRATGGWAVVVDARMLSGFDVPHSLRVRATHKLYRSTRLQPAQIDTLYTEMVCYKFSTLPPLKSLARDAATAWMPAALGRTAGAAQ